jgi:hypothetical protein
MQHLSSFVSTITRAATVAAGVAIPVGLLAGCVAESSEHSSSAAALYAPAVGTSTPLVNMGTRKCAGVAGSEPDGGVVQSRCTGARGQTWHVVAEAPAESPPAIALRNLETGRCAAIVSSSLRQARCDGRPNQLFVAEPIDDDLGGVRLRVRSSGRCLAIPGGSTADGVNVREETCNASSTQRWERLLSSPGVPTGRWRDIDLYRVTYNDDGEVRMLSFPTPVPTTPLAIDVAASRTPTSADATAGELVLGYTDGAALFEAVERTREIAPRTLGSMFETSIAFSNIPTPVTGLTLDPRDHGIVISGGTLFELGTTTSWPAQSVTGSGDFLGWVEGSPTSFAAIGPGSSAGLIARSRDVGGWRYTIDRVAVADAPTDLGYSPGAGFALVSYTGRSVRYSEDPLFSFGDFELYYTDDSTPWRTLIGLGRHLPIPYGGVPIAIAAGECEIVIAVEADGFIRARAFDLDRCDRPREVVDYSEASWVVLNPSDRGRGGRVWDLDATYQARSPIFDHDLTWRIRTRYLNGPETETIEPFDYVLLPPRPWQQATGFRIEAGIVGQGLPFPIHVIDIEATARWNCTDGRNESWQTTTHTDTFFVGSNTFDAGMTAAIGDTDCSDAGPDFHFVPYSGALSIDGHLFDATGTLVRTERIEMAYGEVLSGTRFVPRYTRDVPPSLPEGDPLTFLSQYGNPSMTDGVATVPIPFPFEYLGHPVSEVEISTNGFITFNRGPMPFSYRLNDSLPGAADPNAVVAWWWDDLEIRPGGGAWSTVVGISPWFRRLVITLRGLAFQGDANTLLDVQIALIESTNEIVVNYGQKTAGFGTEDFTASVGWEDFTGALGGSFGLFACTPSCDQNDWVDNLRVTYSPVP